MYSFHPCKVHLLRGDRGFQNDLCMYDEKIDKGGLNDLIQKYSLLKKGKINEYWINNVEIIKQSNGESTFNYVTDLSITYDPSKKLIIREYKMEECIPFNFYTVDIQEEYILYQTIKDGIDILVKEYDEYLTLEYRSESMKSFYTL